VTLGWGIIGLGRAADTLVAPGITADPNSRLVHVVSRDAGRGKAFADKHGAAKSGTDYDAMLADKEVDVVVVTTPNALHPEQIIAAAKAGKHVLCEKPIAMSAREAARLRKIPKGIYVAEAFMVRHSLQWLAARAHARKGEIGDVRAVQVYFSYFNRDPKNVRNMADIGGGGLYDIGCYPITVSRFMFGAEPRRVIATFDRDPKFKTDRMAGGLADFGNGHHLSFMVSTQLAPWQRAQIGGTKGRIEIEIPFNAPPDRPNRYFVQGMQMNEGTWHELPVSDQYQLQAEAFGRVIRKVEKPVWGVEDAIQNMKIIDAFFRSEKSGKWEKP
jgi:predicted dehydrogenase